MLIRCESNNNSDDFYLPEFNSLDEIKEYANNNIPIKCYKAFYVEGNGQVRITNEMRVTYLYLNNYLHYYDITKHYGLMTRETYNKASKTYCSKCKYKNINRFWGCQYPMNNDGTCGCYEKCFEFKDLFKRKE